MAIAPSGPISVNLQKLVDLVAASATFRARIHADAGDDEAREHIHHPHLTRELGEITYPVAVVQNAGPLMQTKFAGGGKNYHRPSGTLRLVLSDEDRYPHNSADSQTDFENWIGGVIGELLESAGVSDNLSILDVRQDGNAYMTKPMHVASQKNQLRLWMADFEIDWGWA